MTSHRVKVQGDLFHGRVPDGAVYIGRAAPGLAASKYANPFKVKVYGAKAAVELYRQHLAEHPGLIEAARRELTGRDAACWCPEPAPGEPDLCHGRPLLDAVACGHTAPVNGCECGDRVRAWWAETRRSLADASAALRAVFGEPADPGMDDDEYVATITPAEGED